MMLARTMRESSTIRMRGRASGVSLIAPPSVRDAHDGTPLDASGNEIVEGGRQLVETDVARHAREVARLEVRGQTVPDLLAQREAGVRGIDAQQADTAQDERKYRRVQAEIAGIADAGDGAAELHGGEHPVQHGSADVVDGAG